MPQKIYATPENISSVIPSEYLKSEIDLLVVDIDSYDYEIICKIRDIGTRPRVVVVEYNPNLPIKGKFSWKYRMNRVKGTNPRMYGASYECWSSLFDNWSYKLVHVSGFCNLIYIRNDLYNNFLVPNISDEVTDTNEKVLEFAERYCLKNFKPSWIDAPYLTAEEISTISCEVS